MRRLALLLAVTSPAAVAAQNAAASSTDKRTEKPNEVVVTATRLDDTERALRDCLARKCRPDQDIAATLAHAENLFVAGDYESARSTLRRSHDRNRRFAAQFPTQVATLERAASRVASHLGQNDELRLGAISSLEALKAGLDPDDWRILGGKLEVADAFALLGRYQAAEDMYREIARRAHRQHLPSIEGFALLRIVALYEAYAQSEPGDFAGAVRLAAKDLAKRTDAALKPYVRAAQLIAARQDARFGDLRPVEALIARYGDDFRSNRPVLIYTPSFSLLDEVLPRAEGGNALRSLSQAVTGQWIDVGYNVQPDGQVGDVEILRRSPDLRRNDWPTLVISSIKRRRYLPLKRDPNDVGIRRVERFTLTSGLSGGTADLATSEKARAKTRARTVSDAPYLRSIDLSIDPEPADASKPPTLGGSI